jgi:O-acetyl-ADP-ribose deacetylase (regulator of RNase III)
MNLELSNKEIKCIALALESWVTNYYKRGSRAYIDKLDMLHKFQSLSEQITEPIYNDYGTNKFEDVFHIELSDIIDQDVDCIVNSTNSELEWEETTLNGDILRGAGSELMNRFIAYHFEHGDLKVGECFITDGFELPAKHVIHGYFPHWEGGFYEELNKLYNTLTNIFTLAMKHNIRTIAIPPVSTGVFNFPKDKAFKAILDVSLFFKHKFDKIIFVSNNESDIELMTTELNKLIRL